MLLSKGPLSTCGRGSLALSLSSGLRSSHSRTQTYLRSSRAGTQLTDWVTANGGVVNGVELANLGGRDGGSGFGLLSSQDHVAGTKLIELPETCHLTYSPQAEDPRLLSVINKVPSELWGARLAIQVLNQRTRSHDSKFQTYVQFLPVGFSGIPIFFPKSAVDALEYPPVVEQVKKRGRWMHDFSTKVLASLPGSQADPFNGTTVDINALGWAMASVTSRAFRTKGLNHPAAMLPLIDMANHSFDPNCEVLQVEGGFALFAKHQISSGEPLLLSYGQLSNDFLLMDYGFIVPGNPYDRVTLRYDVGLIQTGAMVASVGDSDIIVTKWKQKLLEQLDLEGPAANKEVAFGGPQHVDARLLAATRVLLAKDQSEVEGRSLEKLGQLSSPLSKVNEVAVLKVLSGVAAVALSRFSTTLEHDQQMLSAGKLLPPSSGASSQAATSMGTEQAPVLTDELRLAVRFRVEKKLILSAALQALAGRIKDVVADKELRHVSTTAKKGEKPSPSTSKGFGKQKTSK